MSSASGFKRPGVECSHCGESFALFSATAKIVKVEDLADPFPAKCPLCGQTANYPKTAIGTLAAVGNQ
jgi:hypothetical protein